jgi:hypothetical protein
MSEVCLSQIELAARWKISQRYLKLGGRVIYRLSDVEAFEREVQSFPDKLSIED